MVKVLAAALLLFSAAPAFAQNYPTKTGDLTISEVMVETTGEIANYYGEWFEVYNNAGRNLDLNGVTFSDGATDSFTVSGTLTVAAGGYLLFAASGDPLLNGGIGDVTDGSGHMYVYDRNEDFRLDNSDSIVISYGSVVLDTVSWTTSTWTLADNQAQQANLNAFSNEWANDFGYNWCSSDQAITYDGINYGVKGTPGEENQYCPGSNTDSDGDGYTEAQGDCDDEDANINPGEIDGSADPYGEPDDDADCSGRRDDGDTDDDGDGYSETQGDCDDTDEALNPDQPEVNDGADNDCNGCVDDLDSDGDGWTECPGGYPPIECPDLFAGGTFTIQEPYDCGEGDNLIYPCATEYLYNGVDEDCNGFDECDADNDGYTAEFDEDGLDFDKEACEFPDSEPDCDDNNDKVNPGSVEGDPETGGVADGLDNDCNGTVDDPWSDEDGDGYTKVEGDCLDDPEDSRSVLVHPGAPELCDDFLDNDCNGFYNDGCTNPRGTAGIRGGGMLCGLSTASRAAGGAVLLMSILAAVTRRRRGE